MGIASLVLGIIAFIIAVTFVLAPLGAILAVVGLILGIVDAVKKGKAGQKKVISIVGLVICAIMFVILVVESLTIGLVGFAVFDTVSKIDTNEISNSLEEASVNLFNSTFESYEGTKTGSRVKSLLNYVNSSNSSNPNHQVTVYYNGLKKSTTLLREEISSLENYKVSFSKDFDGYIYRVYIKLENTNSNVNNNVLNNTTNTDMNNNTVTNNTTNNTTGKTSSKSSPLSIGEWGIASQYKSGGYIKVPARVTKVTRGAAAAQEVKAYCTSGSSIYKYQDAKEGMEWAVIEYDVDLTNVSSDTSIRLDSKITGTGDNTSIKYNGTTYIVSTMNMTSGYTNSKVANAKFAVQLPVGCSDYNIVLGSSSSTQAFFKGK